MCLEDFLKNPPLYSPCLYSFYEILPGFGKTSCDWRCSCEAKPSESRSSNQDSKVFSGEAGRAEVLGEEDLELPLSGSLFLNKLFLCEGYGHSRTY